MAKNKNIIVGKTKKKTIEKTDDESKEEFDTSKLTDAEKKDWLNGSYSKNIKKTTSDDLIEYTAVYTLVDEALWAHRQKDFINMLDCVNTLSYLLRLNTASDKATIIGKRLASLITSVDAKDCDGDYIKVPAYNLMRAASYYSNFTGKYTVDIVDCNYRNIHMYISDLCLTNDYIGRVVMVSLFELLQTKNLYLPKEIYMARSIDQRE